MLRPVRVGEESAIQLELQGDVDAAFSRVAEIFLSGFAAGRDVGASLAVVVDGRLVVDVWAGHKDRRKTEPWSRDTLCCFFSATKGIAALCTLQAVADGSLNLDEPLIECWPEFAGADKSSITLRHVLCHQAGMVGFHQPVEVDLFYNWPALCDALAAESPWWQPGTKHGYHARTFGYLLGEVLRRRTGHRIGDWLAEKLAGPHALDLHIGLAAGDLGRCAQMLPARVKAGQGGVPDNARRMMELLHDRSTPTGAAFQNPSFGPGYMNTERFRCAELPAMNGHGTARDLARLYSMIPDLLPADVLAQACATASLGEDEVLRSLSHFGLGFMLYHEQAPIGIRPGSFGHAGAGGSMAFYDPENRIAFAYVMNQMQQGVVTGGTSATLCAEALYESLN